MAARESGGVASIVAVVIVALALVTCGYAWHSFDQHGKCSKALDSAKSAARARDQVLTRRARATAERTCSAEALERLDRELLELGYPVKTWVIPRVHN